MKIVTFYKFYLGFILLLFGACHKDSYCPKVDMLNQITISRFDTAYIISYQKNTSFKNKVDSNIAELVDAGPQLRAVKSSYIKCHIDVNLDYKVYYPLDSTSFFITDFESEEYICKEKYLRKGNKYIKLKSYSVNGIIQYSSDIRI